MHVRPITGSKILVVEDEPLIAIEVVHALEREGAVVHHARDVEPALRMADYPSLSAGIIDLRLSTGGTEPICEKLARRAVPFIFYTGALQEVPARFAGAPLISKPATTSAILGALRYALSAEPRDIVAPLVAQPDLLNAIHAGEERIERMRALITRLEALGSDTSASRQLLATMQTALKHMRYSANVCASPTWNANDWFKRPTRYRHPQKSSPTFRRRERPRTPLLTHHFSALHLRIIDP